MLEWTKQVRINFSHLNCGRNPRILLFRSLNIAWIGLAFCQSLRCMSEFERHVLYRAHMPARAPAIQTPAVSFFTPIQGFFLPTGPLKPPASGSGKPDRFDRKSVKTSQIQISNYRRQFNRFPPVNRRVWPVNQSGLSGNRSVEQKTDFNSKFEFLYNMF